MLVRAYDSLYLLQCSAPCENVIKAVLVSESLDLSKQQEPVQNTRLFLDLSAFAWLR